MSNNDKGATPRTDAVYRGDGKTLTLVVGSCHHIEGGGGQCLDCATANENDLSAFYEKRLALVAECSETLERELSALQAKAEGLQSGNVRLWERAQEAEIALTESQARAARLEEALKEIDGYRNHTLGVRGVDSDADARAEDFDRGARMAFYRSANTAKAALADSPNSWLQERLKAERERCAKVCLVTTVSTGLGDKCAAAIRALPEGE